MGRNAKGVVGCGDALDADATLGFSDKQHYGIAVQALHVDRL